MKTLSIAAAVVFVSTLAHAQIPDADVSGGKVAGTVANGM